MSGNGKNPDVAVLMPTFEHAHFIARALDSLLAHAGEIKNKRYREGLLGHADAARTSLELARIHTNVPVEFEPETVYRFRVRE